MGCRSSVLRWSSSAIVALGYVQEAFGWEVERIAVACDGGFALAQVLFRKKAGMSIGYIPRGPLGRSATRDSVGELWARVDEVARRRGTLAIIPRAGPAAVGCITPGSSLVPGPEPIQPARSVKLTSWTTSRSWIRCTRKRATTYAWRCGAG